MRVIGKDSASHQVRTRVYSYCERCDGDRPFDCRFDYDYWHLLRSVGVVTRKQHSLVCADCGEGLTLEPSHVPMEAVSPLRELAASRLVKYGVLSLVVV